MRKIIWRRDGYYRLSMDSSEIYINGVGLACEMANMASGRIVSERKKQAIKAILALAEKFNHFGVAVLIKEAEVNDLAMKTLLIETSALIALWAEAKQLQTIINNQLLEEPLFASQLPPSELKISKNKVAFKAGEVELI